MADLSMLQKASQDIFTRLLRDGRPEPPGDVPAGRLAVTEEAAARSLEAAADGAPRFSVFDPEQARAASEVALGLAVITGAADTEEDGLEAALSRAASEAREGDPELVHHALSMFVTHHRTGRLLIKPRTAFANPERFAPSSLTPAVLARAGEEAGGSTGDERRLDYWREDALANEHHGHWHEVYPTSGLLPADWGTWATTADRGGLVEILTGLDGMLGRPPRDWQAFLTGATPQEILDEFFPRANQVIQGGGWRTFLNRLGTSGYGALFHLNDRHGELFLYMHEQMLARYQAERRSLELEGLRPLDDFAQAIPEGYDPGPAIRQFFGMQERLPAQSFAPDAQASLGGMQQAIEQALAAGQFEGAVGAGVAIDRDNVGANIEASAERLRPEIRPGSYPGLHNIGHGRVASLSEPDAGGRRNGVMSATTTAIRDPVFWRWHKNIDNLGFRWQESQPGYDFAADAPAARLRNDLGAGASRWTSPDLILCRTEDLPGHDAEGFFDTGGQALGERAFGGDAWEHDFTEASVTTGGETFSTVSTLVTEMRRRTLEIADPRDENGEPWRGEVPFLTHDGFSLFIRAENPTDTDAEVTVRIFLAPEPDFAMPASEERRSWIEMDKFLVTLSPGRNVIFRPDELSAVIKKPADKDPSVPPTPGGGDPDDEAYCDCGWPWTLLLPRGTAAGMSFRLLVMLTDATIDRVPQAHHCGSMSYCGAVERYPDTRDMGYPFSRPFERSIDGTFHDLDNAAGRRLVIRHRGDVE